MSKHFQLATLQHVSCQTSYCPRKLRKSGAIAFVDDSSREQCLYLVPEAVATRATLDEPALSKPIPQQKHLRFEAASSGPTYHKMDASRHPHCACTALILQKNPEKLLWHLILCRPLPPSELVLWHPPSEERCISSYITMRTVGVTWFLLMLKADQFSFEALLKAVERREMRR